MTDTTIIELALRTMLVALKLSAPILVTSLVIGFVVSLFQSMTQIQEFTLAFVPKLIGVGIALLLCGNWMLHTLISFTNDLFEGLPAHAGLSPWHDAHGRGRAAASPTCSPRSGSWRGSRSCRRSPRAPCPPWPRWCSPSGLAFAVAPA